MQGGDGKGGDDKFLGLLNHSETTAFFGFQKFLSQYGALANGPNLMASPFLERFHSWSLTVPFQKGDVRILCCPEDRQCPDCGPEKEKLCVRCQVPLCRQCKEALQRDLLLWHQVPLLMVQPYLRVRQDARDEPRARLLP